MNKKPAHNTASGIARKFAAVAFTSVALLLSACGSTEPDASDSSSIEVDADSTTTGGETASASLDDATTDPDQPAPATAGDPSWTPPWGSGSNIDPAGVAPEDLPPELQIIDFSNMDSVGDAFDAVVVHPDSFLVREGDESWFTVGGVAVNRNDDGSTTVWTVSERATIKVDPDTYKQSMIETTGGTYSAFDQ